MDATNLGSNTLIFVQVSSYYVRDHPRTPIRQDDLEDLAIADYCAFDNK